MSDFKLRPQCGKCPWRTPDDPSLPFTEAVFDAARAGEGFVCHVRMGPCHGPVHAGFYDPEREVVVQRG